MKNILYIAITFFVVVLTALSCRKESELWLENDSEEFTITATIAGSGTKVTFAEQGSSPIVLHPSWELGDIVIGFDENGSTYGFEVTKVDGTTGKAILKKIKTGDYAGNATTDPANGTKMYVIYAPGKRPSDIDISAKSLTVSIASQAADKVPAIMSAQGTVTGQKLSLEFTNQTSVIGLRNPEMALPGRTYTSITLSGDVIYDKIVLSLDGDGNLVAATYRDAGSITTAVNFTSNATTRVGAPLTCIATCPLSFTIATDIILTTNNGEVFALVVKALEAGKYYYTTPVFSPAETGVNLGTLTEGGNL